MADAASLHDRFQRVVHGLEKPTPDAARRAFHGITNNEKRRRAQLVTECIILGMSAEQIVDFLPTWGVTLSRSQVSDYMTEIIPTIPKSKMPPRYRRSEGEQSHHDYFTWRFFIRIAQDAAKAGYRTRKIQKGRTVEGMRFRPDLNWWIIHYLFYLELQLSDLTETRWTVKFANYFRLRETGLWFRALFVIDQQGDMNYARRFAREFLKKKNQPDLDLCLFINLDDLKSSANLATDEVWITPWGKRTSLLQWL